MTTDERTRSGKLQYYLKREAGNIYALLSSKIDEYKYFIGIKYYPHNKAE